MRKLKGWGHGLLVLFVLACCVACRSTAQRRRNTPAPVAPFPDVQGTPVAWELNEIPEVSPEWSELAITRLARPGAKAEAVGDVAIHAMTRQGDALWIATDAGLLHLNPTTLIYDHITTADGLGGAQVAAVAVAEDGGVWAATSGGLSTQAPGAAWINYTAQNTGGDLPEGALTAVLPFQGKVWVGTERGARVFTPESGGMWQAPANIPAARVLALTPGPNADVWVVTSEGTYRVTDNVIEKISKMWAPSALARNAQGWLWVAQEGYPTLIKPGAEWEYLQGGPEALRRDVIALAPGHAPERVWIAARSALGRYQQHQSQGTLWQTLAPPAALNPAAVTTLALDGRSDVWIGTTSELWRYRESWERLFSESPPPFNPYISFKVTLDGRGHLWVVPGLWCFDGQTWQSYQSKANVAQKSSTVLVLGDGADGVWAIQGPGAASHFDGDTWRSSVYEGESLSCATNAAALDAARNSLWIGSACGLTRVTWDAAYTSFKWHTFEALRDIEISGVAIRKDGSVWVAAGRWGLLQYRDGDWTVYDRQRITRLVQDAEGSLWMLRAYQLVRFDGQRWEAYPEIKDIRRLLPDQVGGLWVLHNNEGLSYLRHGARWLYTPADGLPNPISDIALNSVDQRLWLVSSQSTFFRLDGPRWERIQLP
ncbi:MAG TPA: hypothetical protein PKH77_02240 [Anaerolineae bacterium]|nr:hypothetical protein [Anaerolineae bacterium]